MMAPTAAPPPAPTAVRLPRPLPDSVTSVVFSRYSSPCTVTELRVTVIAGVSLELACGLGLGHGSGRPRSLGNHDFVAHHDGLGDGSVKEVSRIAGLRTDGLIGGDHDLGCQHSRQSASGRKHGRGRDSGAFCAPEFCGAGAVASGDAVAAFPVFPLGEAWDRAKWPNCGNQTE